MQRHVAATDGSELLHQPDLLITLKDDTGFIDWLGLTPLCRVLNHFDRSGNSTIACLRLLGVFDRFHGFALMSVAEGSEPV